MIYLVTHNKQLFNSEDIKEANLTDIYQWICENKIIGLDTETTGLSAYIDNLICYQIGNKETQFVIDSASHPIWLFKSYFEDSTKLWLLQNFKFDGRFLLKHEINIARTTFL